MPAALLPVDLATLLFTVGIVVLVVSTLVMVAEMLPRRRLPGSPSPWAQPGRGGRPGRRSTPYAGVPLSPDAAQVLSVAQQRAGAKQAGLELGLVGIPPSPVALAPLTTPLVEPSAPLAAVGAGSPTPIALGPIAHEPMVQEPTVIEVEPRQEPRRVVRSLSPGEIPTSDMVMDLLQELAERDPERLAEIIKEWLRSDLRRRYDEDEL
jgi:hypothetical protein